MQATGINPLLVLVKKEFPRDTKLYHSYYRRYQEVRELMEKARPPPQVMTEAESRNWKTLSQIDDKRVQLQRRVNRSILPKGPGQLTTADKVILIRYLVLCLYSQSPSLRNDYSNLPVIRFEDMHTPSAKTLTSGNGNYLLEYAKGQFRMVLKDFKTAKTYGEQAIDLPTRTCNVIAETLEVFPRKYLLSRMRTPDEPMSRNYLTKFCCSIFDDANVGVEQAVAAPTASASESTKASGPPSIKDVIMDLAGRGLYAIPVRMFWDSNKGKKDADFPYKWSNMVDRNTWNDKIDAALSEVSNANGVAILTGASRLLVVDVDNSSTPKKRAGIELWDRLIATHGEPSTLKAKSGSGGLHFYFRINSLGLNRTRNFAGLKSGGTLYGIDSRATGGIIFAHPAAYVDEKLGELSLKAALQDATSQRVHHSDDMRTITQYTEGSEEVQRLLLKFMAEHAAPQAYFNLGRLFGYFYQIEGRMLTTRDTSEKKKDALYFYVWNGASWIQDAANMVASVFTLQMGVLLAWYEGKREKCLEELRSQHPDLQGLGEGEGPQSRSKQQAELIKAAQQGCLNERDRRLPSFGRINVQDIGDVRKCLPAVVNELFVEDLMDLFDQDDHVANAPNGLIDLRTGNLSGHHPQDLCSNTTSTYIRGASGALTARFRSFLMDVLPPGNIDWLQLFLGYCLTGETSEELFVIMNGEGANGKSRLAAAIRRAFGSYSTAGNKAIFIKPTFKANASSASTHLMHIKSKRFVTNEESEKDDHLNGAFLKEAASGNPIEARELFCKPQEYIPRYKLCLFTNYRPHFPSDDAALLRRIVLIMFDFIYKAPDELDVNNKRHKPMDLTLKSYFESAEGAADVLDFCVEGATMYYARKEQSPESKILSPIPHAFRAAAQEYAAENDHLQCFIDESCVKGDSFGVTKVDFVNKFLEFLYAGGHDTSVAGDGLARAMNVKGYTSTSKDGKKNRMIRMLDSRERKTGFFGIRLKTPEEMEAEFNASED
ncbi:hypothetical protein KFL_001520110 [Klebsormidium nitens]|uniref:SF3 helicase domain-containing protein n=1 Tax=Klebsormidium nitens TaxID=105231 RepID=A0A1Y1I2Y1_KLENI|nr:hypothetical protein KFL_001520110 [Klebsormidium nitens]|eukprot:GAQ83541.1 hypothetical protein KFL_001520110 [Klebsormidium nitens]